MPSARPGTEYAPFATFALGTFDDRDGETFEERLALTLVGESGDVALSLEYRPQGSAEAWGETDAIGIRREHTGAIGAALIDHFLNDPAGEHRRAQNEIVSILDAEALAGDGEALTDARVATLRRILRERDALRDELGAKADKADADAIATATTAALEALLDAKLAYAKHATSSPLSVEAHLGNDIARARQALVRALRGSP